MENTMKNKIGFFSDTHTLEKRWYSMLYDNGLFEELSKCDILVFCGDMGYGNLLDTHRFFNWFCYDINENAHKIFIPGNHDFVFERNVKDMIQRAVFNFYPNLTYLNDSGVCINGLNFWGSPVSPEFNNWAFNRRRGEEIKKHWELIPDNTDILITHCPPYGILDEVHPKFRHMNEDKNVGCKELLKRVGQIRPLIHAFGHIHESYGVKENGGMTFINCSSIDENYKVKNPPVIVEV